MPEIVENGPWKAGRENSSCSDQYEVFIESEDFTHDVRLIVDVKCVSRKCKSFPMCKD